MARDGQKRSHFSTQNIPSVLELCSPSSWIERQTRLQASKEALVWNYDSLTRSEGWSVELKNVPIIILRPFFPRAVCVWCLVLRSSTNERVNWGKVSDTCSHFIWPHTPHWLVCIIHHTSIAQLYISYHRWHPLHNVLCVHDTGSVSCAWPCSANCPSDNFLRCPSLCISDIIIKNSKVFLCFCVYEGDPLKPIEGELMHRRGLRARESTPGGSTFTKGRQIVRVEV